MRIKNREKMQNKRGSALVAVLLTLFMVAVISNSLIKRSLVSLEVSIETKETNAQYQNSDTLIEKILLALNKIETLSVNNLAKINEMTITNVCNCATDDLKCDDFEADDPWENPNFCGDEHKIAFYGVDGTTEIDDEDSIEGLSRIKMSSDDDSSVERAILVTVPKRVALTPEAQSYDCLVSSECDEDVADLLASCGSNCYKIAFSYFGEDIEKLSGAKIILEASTERKGVEIEIDSDPDNFDELVCDEGAGICYFYIGSETEDKEGFDLAVDGNLSFRLSGNASFQLDSLDYVLADDTGNEIEFDFTP